MNQVMHENNPEYYRIPDNRDLVSQLLLLYEMSGGSKVEEWVDYDYKTLRLLVEVNDFDSEEIEKEMNYMRNMTEELFPDGNMKMTGSLVQFSMIQRYIVKGEIRSFLIALAVIGILMILVFRSIKAGIIGLIPNVMPAIIVGGAMGLTGIPLDFMTMNIVPMLLGIAVDDTIHFITHAKYEFEKHGSYDRAISVTFRTVGKALFMTTFILVATFSVFTTSMANMYVHLGIFIILGLSSALIADYCMTPILVSWSKPFGKENHKIEEK